MPTRRRNTQTAVGAPTPETPAPPTPSCFVFGRVRRPDGRPVPQVEVEAWHRNLRTERRLGMARTDPRGFYVIGYDRPGKLLSVDLVVRAMAPQLDRIVANSGLFCHARRILLVDLVVGDAPYRGQSEFERLTLVLEPRLDDTPLSALTANDVQFLACTTREDRSLLTELAAAYRYEKSTGVPAAALYGLFRQGLPSDLPALLAQKTGVQRRALTRAIAQSLVPESLTPQVDDVLHRIKQAAAALALADGKAPTPLAELLDTTGLPADTKSALLTSYALHEGTLAEYWSAMETDPEFGPQMVAELQFTLQLGTLAGGHVPMMEQLRARDVASVRQLVELSAEDWLSLVEGSGVPPAIPGDTPADRAERYAAALRATLERAFPTPTIVAGLRRRRQAADDELLRFFDNSPDFEFTANIDRYLRANPDTALAGITDVPALTGRLKGMQRLYRLVPDVDRLDAITALSAAGVGSAQDVVRLGRERLTGSIGRALGARAAGAIYAAAEQTAAAALTVFGQYGNDVIGATPAAIGSSTTTTTTTVTVPSWETLFGPVSPAVCAECRSVHSPAAYLVDLLQFVGQQPAAETQPGGSTVVPTVTEPDGTVRDKTALDVLFERRADLGEIELSCANDTELAYIDLVNEILERAVAGPTPAYQTTWTAAELRANAEHLNESAYRRLAQQVYPRELPFNLWLSEARTYLGHLGVTLHELMDVLQPPDPPSLELAIAVERLALSPEQARIVTGTPTSGRGPADYWGVAAADWPAALSDLATFLRQAGLSCAALVDLLSARFVNPSSSITVQFATPGTMAGATIRNLNEPALDRMHRFLRLQRALGWTTLELDAAVTALAVPDLTAEFLVRLAQIRRLGEQTGAPVIESLSWWSTISTALSAPDDDATSPYDDLFRNNAVLSPTDPAFELNADRDELLTAGSETIGGHTPAILAALAITDAELAQVLELAALTDDDGLTLDHLSRLHRIVSLARALDLSVADLASVCGLTGIDPFVSPRATLDLAARAAAIDESDFSIAELDYLLRHVHEKTSGLAPTTSAVTLVLDRVGAALAAVAAENAFVPDPTGALTQNRLALLLEADDVQTAMAIVAGTSTLPHRDQASFVDRHFAAFLDPADAKLQLLGPAALADPQARYEYVLRPLLAHLVTTLRTDRAMQLLADALGLEVAVTEAALTRYVSTPTSAPRTVIEPFLEIAPDADEYSAEVLDSYRLLHKIATVLTKLAATADELPWVFERGPALGWLDLARLPLTIATDAAMVAGMFEGWTRLMALYGLRDRHPAGDATIFDVLGMVRPGGTRAEVLTQLATVTGWSHPDLDFLTGTRGFALTYPADYRDERYLVRLEAAVKLLRRIGLSAEQVAGWRAIGDLAEARKISRSIKSTVKAKYDNDEWLEIAAPLKNALREPQRTALAAYLIATRDELTDTSDLYERYLIDVDMGACMTTSRIKQAHSSVQLFVQRCLMNLEPNVALSEAAAEQWQWIKLYRVWEANRKIFLYPENWIEPELRDDKSPFFEQLENELLQNEVTNASAEAALANYLRKLGEVANLNVRAVVHEHDGDSTDVLHVFGRSHNSPNVYYYRALVDGSYWTPWKHVDTDVQGEHLLAVVWNRRLHLMWPLFREVARPDVTPTTSEEEEPAGPRRCPSLVSLLEDRYLSSLEAEGFGDEWTDFIPSIRELEDELTAGLHVPGFDYQAVADLTQSTMENAIFKTFGFGEFDSVIDSWWDCRKAPPPPAPDDPVETPEPIAWEVQLAWSEYHDGAWTAKQVADGLLRTTFYPKRSFVFKPTSTESDLLAGFTPDLDTTPQLDTAQITAQPTPVGELNVKCVASDTLLGTFRFTGCGGQVVVTAEEDGTSTSSHLFDDSVSLQNMRLVEAEDDDLPLTLVASEVDPDGDFVAGAPLRHITALNRTPGRFALAVPHQYNQFVSQDDFFYQDQTRCFHVSPGMTGLGAAILALQDRNSASFDAATLVSARSAGDSERAVVTGWAEPLGQASDLHFDEIYRFGAFDHAHACTFQKEVVAAGAAGLMRRSVQARSTVFFSSTYDPVESVVPPPYPLQNVDFAAAAAYAGYNWETFFHVPLLIATRLSQNQRFEEAQLWFHYIFNPTARTDPAGVTGPERYWVFQPFYLATVPPDLTALLESLSAGDAALEEQVARWRAEPFNPHLIARLRPAAYQKAVVMKYLDNLIAWGDALFRQDTIESLNEATQLYVLAADILGTRPEPLPASEVDDTETYNTLAGKLDDFSNALVEIENALAAPAPSNGSRPSRSGPLGGWGSTFDGLIDVDIHLPSQPPLPTLETLYFCIPDNDQLVGYWDTLADRLFKLRNCMNIEGVVRELPLYEPPINPALLVQAAAAGVDLSSALNEMYAPLPAYRFQVILQRAVEFCGDVRSLGAALLAALKDQDAEELALLRATHEVETLDAVRSIRERQVEDSAKGLEGLEKSRSIVEGRHQYYTTLVTEDLSPYEQAQLTELEDANRITLNAQREEILGSTLYSFPELTLDFPPNGSYGGLHLGQAAQAVARWHGLSAVEKSHAANRAALEGGHARRRAEWRFQLDSAERELAQLDVQIAAAGVRLANAENELTNHDAQAARATAVRDVMTGKYTTQELYGWMVSQVSALYSQSYQLAYDLAKSAERAYEHELGVEGAGFIQFGYWDSLKKGLLSGERLYNDLRRMEAAYLQNDTREYEITKHVSLAMVDPVALIKLRREGLCHVEFPEALFDLDFPGLYMRRLKTVSLTVPSVAGPYAGINCKLSLESSSIRVSAAASSSATSAGYLRKAALDADERFRDELGLSQSIVISLGQNDHGLFDVNLGDPRYLPFERRGVISTWRLELTPAFPAFDYESISDVVFGLRYTAREGGETLRQECLGAIEPALQAMTTNSGLTGLTQAFSVRHEFADAWYRFLNPVSGSPPHTLELPIDASYFPHQFQRSELRIRRISLYLLPDDSGPSRVRMEVRLAGGTTATADLTLVPQPADSYAYRPYLLAEGIDLVGVAGAVSLTTSDPLSESAVENLIVVFEYETS